MYLVSRTLIAADEVDDFDHMAMDQYARLVNQGIQSISEQTYHGKEHSVRFVAARLYIEYKKEVRHAELCDLYFSINEACTGFILLDFRFLVGSQVRARGRVTIMALDEVGRHSCEIPSDVIEKIAKLMLD